MKKFYVYGLLALVAISFSGSLQASEALVGAVEKPFEEALSKVVGEELIEQGGLGVLEGGEKALLDTFEEVSTAFDKINEGLPSDVLESAKVIEAEIGGAIGEGIGGVPGNLKLEMPELSERIAELGEVTGKDVGGVETSVTNVNPESIAEIKKASPKASGEVESPAVAEVDSAKIAARQARTSFNDRMAEYNRLKAEKAALPEGADTAKLDADIEQAKTNMSEQAGRQGALLIK